MNILTILLRIEWLKAAKRRIFWVAIGAFGLFTVIRAVIGIYMASTISDVDFTLPERWPDILGAVSGFGPLFTAILMILLFAPEFSWRTARQNIIDGLSKEQFFTGKVILLAGLVLLFMAVAVLVGIGSTMFSPDESGSGIFRPSDLSYMGGIALGMLIYGSFGLVLSTHLRSSGSALGVLFLYIIVEGIIPLLTLRMGSRTLRDAMEFLPFKVVENLGDNLAYYPAELLEMNPMRPELDLVPLGSPDIGIYVIVALAYIVVLLGLSLLNLRKRDL
ncbi:MAG: ABC transporter permease subunit [Bacteroidetes bacterium]|nr:ABC transporter permease subunit [Bacteroidota bacterium]MDE2672898.1 ABC transporter permease subunit [Bacteroidota bacterium]